MAGVVGTKYSKEKPGALIFIKMTLPLLTRRPSYAELLYEMYTQTHTTVTHHDTDPYESLYHLLLSHRSFYRLDLRSKFLQKLAHA